MAKTMKSEQVAEKHFARLRRLTLQWLRVGYFCGGVGGGWNSFRVGRIVGHVEQESEVATRLERLGFGRRMGLETLTPQNLARTYTDAPKSPHSTSVMNLQVNGIDAATELILPLMRGLYYFN
jgi:hypothetical protein